MDSKILERLRKLQAITPDRGATVDEAAAAAARLQALLTRYQLGMDDIPDAAEPEERPVGSDFHKGGTGWRHNLWCRLARINGGRGLYDVNRKRFVIVGTEATRASTVYLYTYAEREISRLRTRYTQTLPARFYGMRRVRPIIEGNSFAAGAAAEFATKCEAARKAARSEATSTALVRVDRDEDRSNARVRELYPRIRSTRSTQTRDYTSWQHGQAAGRAMAIPGQGLTQAREVKRLGES